MSSGRRWTVALGVALVALVAWSCRLPLGLDRDESAVFQTDAMEYRASTTSGVSVTFTVTYTNPSEEARYLGLCTDSTLALILVKSTASGWLDAVTPNCPRALYEPIEVPTHGTHTETVTITGYRTEGAVPQFQTSVPGTYRLRGRVYRSWDPETMELGPLVPVGSRVSNRFRIRE